jgi:peptidoglycan hydrolase FlgJ
MKISTNPNLVQTVSARPLTNREKTDFNLKSLRESCREMEAMFVQQMYQAMRKNVPENGLVPKDNATKIFQDMLDTQMASETAKGKGIGLGEKMYNQLKGSVERKK